MANFRTTSDLVDGVLRRCGELTSDQGTSPLAPAVLLYLNQIHHTIITGGNELEVDIDESWVWAKARRPIVLTLNPPVTEGSVTLTQGSTAGTFSTAPTVSSTTISVEGWYLRLDSGPEVYRIAQHDPNTTTFSLDVNFPQTSYTGTFNCFQLEYDLTPQTIIIDSSNDQADFISNGTAVQTLTLSHGSFEPVAWSGDFATRLGIADTNGNTYSSGYNTNTRTFVFASNLAGTAPAIFSVVGNGPTSSNSIWPTLGFDYTTTAGTVSAGLSFQYGAYPFGAVARLTQPARIYYGYQFGYGADSGAVCNLDSIAFDRDYPLIDVRQGTPQYFTVTGERSLDGRLTVRFNKYPATPMRVEFEHIPYPRDLFNNTSSIPLIPRKWLRVLEFGASYYLSLDKRSDMAPNYLALAQQMLKAMMKANRQELAKTSRNFGGVIARTDLMPEKNYRRLNVYGYDSGDI